MTGQVASWYEATANPASERPALAGDLACDVAVLGAGYTGLGAALALAERGFKVVVVEGRRVGWGASGRNGGQFITGYNRTTAEIAAMVGRQDARKLWEMVEEAKHLLHDRVARHGINCALTPGYLFAAFKPRQVAELAGMAEEWAARDGGYEGLRLIDRDEIRAMVGASRYVGGLFDPRSGHLHPLNYALGLAEAAERAGVRIFENTEVTAIDTGDAPSLTTAQGRVRARFLVIAGNALLGRLVPGIHRKIAPVGTYIGATEPLGRARMRSVLRDDIAVSDMNFVLNYYRRTPDHRLLFGARVSYSGLEPPALKARMRRSMLRIFPQLADIRMEMAWGGHVDISVNRLPHLGRLGPASYFAQGFSGHGVLLTGMAGQVIAEAIAGQAERFDVFARIPHTDFPGGVLRTPALMLAMTWFRLRDLM